ncbi:MAG: hypothetical protein ACRDTP_01700, partial [Mycobacteriales bacterium]
GSAPAGGRFATLRRHVSSCAVCAEVLAAETRGRALAASLPIHAPSDDDRADLLARASSRASTVLPAATEVQAELAGERGDPPLIPAFVIVLSLAVALLLGAGLGVLLRGGGNADAASISGVTPTSSVTGSATPPPSRLDTATTQPPTSTSVAATTSSAGPTSSAPAAPTTTAAAAAVISLSPASGPSGTVIAVRGHGFPPDTLVTVAYGHRGGGANDQTATVDGQGRFTTRITAADPSTPAGLLTRPVDNSGPHTVTATDGAARAVGTFEQTT